MCDTNAFRHARSASPPLPAFHSHLHYLPDRVLREVVGVGGARGRKMLLFLNESCSLSKTTLSGKGRRGEEVNALCQDWQATEPRAINSERERHFLLVNAILNYYYFIWQKGKAHQGFIAQGVQGIVNGETEGHQNRVGFRG